MWNRILEIWRSFRRMPLWVQIWVAFILVPVNMAALVFVQAPGGVLIAVLAIGAMALNLPIMLAERGFSKAMALPHVLLWVPLLVVLMGQLGDAPEGVLGRFLWLLFAVDLISLGFDVPDALKWLRGDRAIA